MSLPASVHSTHAYRGPGKPSFEISWFPGHSQSKTITSTRREVLSALEKVRGKPLGPSFPILTRECPGPSSFPSPPTISSFEADHPYNLLNSISSTPPSLSLSSHLPHCSAGFFKSVLDPSPCYYRPFKSVPLQCLMQAFCQLYILPSFPIARRVKSKHPIEAWAVCSCLAPTDP